MPNTSADFVRVTYMPAEPIRSVVILGGGTAGWMAAAALSRMLDMRSISVTLVESDQIGTIGVGEATIPTLLNFNELLGLDEAEFMRETKATFKLGIEFVDWAALGERYIHPFGTYGLDRPEVKFHQMWLRLRQAGAAVGEIGDYNLTLVAAKLGRFGRQPPRSGLPPIRYAYHLDAGLYARFLRRYAEARSVTRVEGIVATVDRQENGFVRSVSLQDGRTISGDLFVDCSGFRGLLIAGAPGSEFDDWSHWLPCDRAVAQASERTGPLLPLTRSTADSAGWRWRIPLQHRVGNGYVYSSAYITDDAAAARLAATLDAPPLGEPRLIQFRTGYRRTSWNRNVVAVGLSSGFIEPLESTSIHLIQTAISRLLLLFPDSGFDQALIDEFNRSSQLEYEQVRDFIILHYKATARSDTPFWMLCRDMEVPERLQQKIDLFRSGGRIFRLKDELFTENSWLAVLLGQRIIPQGHDPVVDSIAPKEMENALLSLRSAIQRAASALPEHAEFIRSYCAASHLQEEPAAI
jgi:tryptophan halogenase